MRLRTEAGSDDEKEELAAAQPHRSDFPALMEAVSDALLDGANDKDPIEVARHCGQLLEALHQQVLIVQSRRDAALVQVLQFSPGTSHYALARELGVSRQRIDQLAARVESASSAQDAHRSGDG